MIRFELHQSELNQLWFSTGPVKPFGTHSKENATRSTDIDRLKVLIVEDEFFIALDAQAQVESLGCTVVGIAVSADEAIAIVERETPDLVLMDIRLQGSRDGIEAAREIHTRFGSRIIFVTANTDPQTRLRANSIQPFAFLEKPLTIMRLRAVLST